MSRQSSRSLEAALRALGAAVQHARSERGIGQADLAQLSNISLEQLARIEAGVERPELGTILALSLALDVPAGDLCAFLIGHDETMAKLARNGDLLREVYRAFKGRLQ